MDYGQCVSKYQLQWLSKVQQRFVKETGLHCCKKELGVSFSIWLFT